MLERQFWQWASARIAMASRLKSSCTLQKIDKIQFARVDNFQKVAGDPYLGHCKHFVFQAEAMSGLNHLTSYFYWFDHITSKCGCTVVVS